MFAFACSRPPRHSPDIADTATISSPLHGLWLLGFLCGCTVIRKFVVLVIRLNQNLMSKIVLEQNWLRTCFAKSCLRATVATISLRIFWDTNTLGLLGPYVWAESLGRMGSTSFDKHFPHLLVLHIQHENLRYVCDSLLFHYVVQG